MRRNTIAISLCLGLAALLLSSPISRLSHAAGPWYVAPGGSDSNACSSAGSPCATIDGAIGKASSGDTVYVAVGTYTGTDNQVVQIDRDITISGGWDSSFSMQEGTSIIDGEGSRRGMYINQNVTVVVERLTVRNGYTANEGGGVYNAGTLTLDDTTVSGNAAAGNGGGIHNGAGTLILRNSSVSDNEAGLAGGSGGGIYSSGAMTLSNSTVSGNWGGSGGGIHNGGDLSIDHSTITNNESPNCGGISGGGTIQNSILFGNRGAWTDCVAGDLVSAGHNLVGDATHCDFTPSTGDVVGADPQLGPLIGHLGYHPLQASSPARDAIPLAQCTVSTDQRGVARPQGAACDMGAYEYALPGPAASVVAVGGTPQRTPPRSTFWWPFEAAVLDGVGSPVSGTIVTFVGPATGAGGTFAHSSTYITTAVTDEHGVATAAAFTANGLTGSYTVTATVSGVATPATFSLGNSGWYVATDGSDGNDCQSPGTPCATINGASSKAGFLAGDTVLVGSGTYAASAGDEVVLLDKNVRLYGGWDDSFSAQSSISTIDGGDARRGLTVDYGATAIVEYFAVQNGSAHSGGGVYNRGILTVNGCIVSGNTATGYSGCGGIHNEGGVVALNSTVVSDNTATGHGDSCGGIHNAVGSLSLNSSAVVGNETVRGSGGIDSSGVTTLTNSTVSGNRGGAVGGIHNDGDLSIDHSTITDNEATNCGGISGGGTIQNSILSGNRGAWTDCVGGDLVSAGHNLVGDATHCDFTPSTGDVVGADPQLGPLIGHLGYHPLQASSPARDAIPLAQCTVTTDQRGVARPQGPGCDMGAYEYTAPGPAASVVAVGGTPQRTPPSSTFWMPLEAAVLDGVGSPVSGTIVTFAGPASGASGTFADSGTYTTTAVTDERGVATAAAFTANGLTGSYTVTATVSGVVTPAIFDLGNGGWYVATGGSDDNDCQSPDTPCATINGALGKVGSLAGDTVLVASGTYVGEGGDEVVLLDKSARLSGGWDVNFTEQNGASTVDGQAVRHGIVVERYVNAEVERFVVQNGDLPGSVGAGGILNLGRLALIDCSISDNLGGGIGNWGKLTLTGCTVRGNLGGGIRTGFEGFPHLASATLNHSAVSNNTAEGGAGGISNYGLLILNNSSISSNLVSRYSGETGGIGSDAGTVILNNSTVSGNSGTGAGGIAIREGTAELYSSTVTGNRGGKDAGGIAVQYGSATVRNTILAGNTADRLGPDCRGTIDSLGYNLIGDTAGCTFAPATGDLTGVDPNLGPFIGQPGYHPLLLGSAAIDAGNPAGCIGGAGPLFIDQRGAPRVGRCDIGAYEYTVPGPPGRVAAYRGTPQRAGPTFPFVEPLQAVVVDALGSPVEGATVVFGAPASGPSGTFEDTGTTETTALTDEGGICTAAILTANDLLGSYTVTATVTGAATPAHFALSNFGWYVALSGDDASDCHTPGTPCATVGGVLEKVGYVAGDTVLVATGTYTGTGEEVVLIDKDIRLSGGWNAGFTVQDGMSTVEGEGIRGGIKVNADLTVVVEGFVINGGRISNVGGALELKHSRVHNTMDLGIANQSGSLTLSDCVVTESATGIENGAGASATLIDSTVSTNSTGFINSSSGTATLIGSTISDNGTGLTNGWGGTATVMGGSISGNGTGFINGVFGTATVIEGTVSGNSNRGILNGDSATLTVTNSLVSDNGDGGIDNGGQLTLVSSAVTKNRAPTSGGAGIRNSGIALLYDSVIHSNTAQDGGGISNQGIMTLRGSAVSSNTITGFCCGGGISNDGRLTLTNSTVSGNVALLTQWGGGGGIYNSTDGAVFLNSSTVNGNAARWGGGILNDGGTVVLQNTILAGNTASDSNPNCSGLIDSSGYNIVGDTSGCAFMLGEGDLVGADPKLGTLTGSPGYHPLLPDSPAIDAGDPAGCADHLGNPLLTDQRGFPRFRRCDIGAYEMQPIGFSTKVSSEPIALPGEQLTYTIVLTNGGVTDITGVCVTDALPISLDYVSGSLAATGGSYGYDSQVITWTGKVPSGTAVTITFGATARQVLGLTTNSAVISGGGEIITRSAVVDIAGLQVTKRASSGTVQAGEQLTYTIRVTNTANVDLHATVTDVLPSHVTSSSPLVWTPTIAAPGGAWEQTVVVAVDLGYAGVLTNLVQVTTEEGATGTYTETTQSVVTPMPSLVVTKRASSDSVLAGEQLTYTVRVTNTGNIDLHATVTDVLPSHATASGPLVWTPTIAAPGGVWEQDVVVTVEGGYSGLLTNNVQVTTEEGASGSDSVTCTSIGGYDIYLPLVLRQHP